MLGARMLCDSLCLPVPRMLCMHLEERGLPSLTNATEAVGEDPAGREDPADRDIASVAAAALCVAAGADIVRMHNVGAGVDAVRVADAITAAAPGFGAGPAHSVPADASHERQAQEGGTVKGVQTATITTVVTALSGVAGAVM